LPHWGLEPDAGSSEIEQAYRRLIKQHHPDREGGDASRAAEINRGYRELRGHRHLKEPLDLHEDWPLDRRRGWAWLLLALILAGTGAVVFLSQPQLGRPQLANANGRVGAGTRAHGSGDNPMEQPIELRRINLAASEALQMSRSTDEMTLAKASSDCHHQFRRAPTLRQFDRCAAFDDAVVQLEDRDPLRDQGPFAEIAVTGRLWSRASELSQDSVAIDGRLDRIRRQVELALAAMSSADRSPSEQQRSR